MDLKKAPRRQREWRCHKSSSALNSNYPEEDVFGRIEPSCVDASGVGGAALTHHPTGEAGDGALRNGGLLSLLTPRDCVSHHEVYGTLSGAADLQNNAGMN